MDDGTEQQTAAQNRETDHADGCALDATGAYETAGGVVLYDTEDPLAWVQSDQAVRLAEMT